MLTKRKILGVLKKESLKTSGTHKDVFNFAYNFINGMEDSTINICIKQYKRRRN